ncbi:pentalenic acid synthase [Actinocrispum wychmicini]|uniref:Pentalenic acid synthase n=2 Tax=Actinocrispum wychmicini TaxID=1213861 RepID=A0A4V2S746_9PSEU|nr:pentalenic acid synthase [Actinocrispum wychmicini]
MTQAPEYPQARTCPYHPSPAYEPMREGPPLQRVTLWNGLECWTVTGHAEARQLLADPRVSADRRRDGFPTVSERFAGLTEAKPTFLAMDDPEHNRIRRMMISEFTVRRFKELKPKIVAVVDDAIDGLLAAGSPTDLVEHFSLPVPSMVICHMLGVPYADHEFFQKHSRLLVQGTSDDVRVARVALVGYLAELAMDPPPGLIARLKADQVATGQLSKEDLAINAMVLLLAGHETTASMLSLGVITLLDHPDQLALLKSDPAAAATSVEELLRYLSIVDAGPSRIATEDIEIGGVTVKAGDGLVITSSLANRDPSVFADPDSFDITRPARHHVAFGYGVHQCLGQNLARMELELALPALFRRIPTLRLDVAVADLTLRPAATIQGVNSLPVAW